MFLLLERLSEAERRQDPDEQRHGIGRQPFTQPGVQGLRIKARASDHGSHAGAAIVTGHGYAIDADINHARTRGNSLGDLERRDVLALPAESVADAIDKIEIA